MSEKDKIVTFKFEVDGDYQFECDVNWHKTSKEEREFLWPQIEQTLRNILVDQRHKALGMPTPPVPGMEITEGTGSD